MHDPHVRRSAIGDSRGGTVSELCIALPLFIMMTVAVISFSVVAAQQAILCDSLRIAGRKASILAPPKFAREGKVAGCADVTLAQVNRQLRRYTDLPRVQTTSEVEVDDDVRGLSISISARLYCPLCSLWGNSDQYSENMFFPLEDQTACQ